MLTFTCLWYRIEYGYACIDYTYTANSDSQPYSLYSNDIQVVATIIGSGVALYCD